MSHRFLILDTPDQALVPLEQAFKEASHDSCDLEWVLSFEQLEERLRSGLHWDLIVADYRLGDGVYFGVDLIERIHQICGDIPIVAVADRGDVDVAAEAIKAGANDFMVRTGKLLDRVRTLQEKMDTHLSLIRRNRLLKEQNMLLRQAICDNDVMVGDSTQLREVLDRIIRVAIIPRPVLITGERGTGKELVARAIHMAAGQVDRPLISVNCAAFSSALLESELFGHEKGSFTGADTCVHGKFELAAEGTLFLDEIGNMSLSFQQKILRVVEYGTFTRVGGSGEIQVNTRIIAATNADLKHRMQEGEFLRDLYDRLSFEVIHVPALREREGDIPILARHFLNQFMQEIPTLQGKRLSRSAFDVLERYSFPGNVRELKNIIERAAYRDTTNEITPEDIGMLTSQPMSIAGQSFQQQVDHFKQQLVLEALTKANGNQAKAARALGVSYHQYRYFLKKYHRTVVDDSKNAK